jgi:hypothetical protein
VRVPRWISSKGALRYPVSLASTSREQYRRVIGASQMDRGDSHCSNRPFWPNTLPCGSRGQYLCACPLNLIEGCPRYPVPLASTRREQFQGRWGIGLFRKSNYIWWHNMRSKRQNKEIEFNFQSCDCIFTHIRAPRDRLWAPLVELYCSMDLRHKMLNNLLLPIPSLLHDQKKRFQVIHKEKAEDDLGYWPKSDN